MISVLSYDLIMKSHFKPKPFYVMNSCVLTLLVYNFVVT
jgi:hypothetical protein